MLGLGAVMVGRKSRSFRSDYGVLLWMFGV